MKKGMTWSERQAEARRVREEEEARSRAASFKPVAAPPAQWSAPEPEPVVAAPPPPPPMPPRAPSPEEEEEEWPEEEYVPVSTVVYS